MQISVARALAKQKTLLSKMQKLTDSMRTYGSTTTKELSALGSSKDLDENHKQAIAEFRSMQQSLNDCTKAYLNISTAVAKSNLDTYIVAEYLGKISITEAIIIYQKLRGVMSNYSSALQQSVGSAEMKAMKANKELTNSNLATTVTPELYESLLAKPLLLFDKKDADSAQERLQFVASELNMLINESNAITTIDVEGLE